jgi:hypothetical protein
MGASTQVALVILNAVKNHYPEHSAWGTDSSLRSE